MLVTHERHLVSNTPHMLEKGEQLWDVVELQLNVPYFFVNYDIEENAFRISQQALLWQPRTFFKFCAGMMDGGNQRIDNVSLLIPPALSECDRWEMIGLQAVLTATHKKKKTRFVIYVDERGKRYTESWIGDVSDDALENVEQHFPAPVPKAGA